jgi:hypothetical protein
MTVLFGFDDEYKNVVYSFLYATQTKMKQILLFDALETNNGPRKKNREKRGG